ncbi:MAG: UbiA prenyltransferase family protein [Bacteroidales bacterium]|nr:UbiA prenyltransferase family protein [Bacteroidales bacterium]
MFIEIIKLLRPKQWLKNTFVFLPMFFDGKMLNIELWKECIVAFFALSFAASSIYCFNDICDIKTDQKHPKKCKRPLASGEISVTTGYLMMSLCLVVSFLILVDLAGTQKWLDFAIILFYVFMNLFYTVWLKKYPIVDVFIIALGFVLRVVMGGVSTGIELSHWIILMTFLLALFLSFAKRRDDVVIFERTKVLTRSGIDRYNLDFLNQILTIVATVTIVCYIMYTVSEDVMERLGSNYIYVTVIFVLAGILRYMQLTLVYTRSESPTNILVKDRFIQLCIVAWIITFSLIIYF